MNKKLFSILVVLMLWLPASSLAGTSNRIHIEENDMGITIQINGAPLDKVLQAIEGQTGIQFHISPSVQNNRVAVNLNAPDWKTAMKKLLQPYGRMELWNPRLDLTRIHIVSQKAVSGRSQTNNEVTEADRRSSSTLNLGQILKLAKGELNKPLPTGLYADPEIKAFLNSNGIQSPEDMKDTIKAQVIRIKARKILLERDKAK